MVAEDIKKQYRCTIGIECHVQLKTKTKLFSAVGNDAREAPANQLISHIDLGMPGALPVLNKAAIDLAIRAAYALGTRPQRFSKFDRKHYFYPDLPKGYQITQYDQPIIVGGYVDILVDGHKKRIAITRAHLEEDAGKSTHPTGKDFSLVDLNRAGTPLLEVVSEPDMHSAAEAKAYARELYLLMKYAEVSEADLYYGNMRFDVNVSVSKHANTLGTRTETKNLNSFRSVEKAIEYEMQRQIELLEKGQRVVQETRGWDEAKQKTFSQRTKEDAHDYRYFPDPDIPPVVLDKEYISGIARTVKSLPHELRAQFASLGISAAAIETLLDVMPAAKCVQAVLDQNTSKKVAKIVANWLVGVIQARVSAGDFTWAQVAKRLKASKLVQLAEMQESGQLSSTGAKEVLTEMLKTDSDPLSIAKAKGLYQVSDQHVIEQIVDEVLAQNPQAVKDVRAGEEKAIGFLVGQVMKASSGQANPTIATSIINKRLH